MDMAIDTPSPAPPTPPAPSAAAGRQTRAAEAVRLEHQLVRVPLESLRATVRSNHRLAEKEIAAVLSSASAAPAESSAAAVDHLTSLVSRLHGLKRKDLVDIDVFLDAKRVIDSLQNNEVSPALAWCAENKSRLKKSKSKLEFLLRLQEFVEFVKVKNFIQAIAYARKHLAPWGSVHMKELQRVTATLVFRSNTNCTPYKILFEQDRWDYLVDIFKQDFCKLYGMTLEPLLNIYLQAGLTALKTPFCSEGSCPKEDPLSLEGFRKLAEPLPFSKQHHSKLVCYITKELMDTENPPQVLPNGYVYSEKALQEMSKKNDGKITCPRTGDVYDVSECVRAFIS
uniref:Macrophage erythroblast attacher n=1 Tax=Zea mays TaxID=4577 RepID=A0A804PXI9_MAIZE